MKRRSHDAQPDELVPPTRLRRRVETRKVEIDRLVRLAHALWISGVFDALRYASDGDASRAVNFCRCPRQLAPHNYPTHGTATRPQNKHWQDAACCLAEAFFPLVPLVGRLCAFTQNDLGRILALGCPRMGFWVWKTYGTPSALQQRVVQDPTLDEAVSSGVADCMGMILAMMEVLKPGLTRSGDHITIDPQSWPLVEHKHRWYASLLYILCAWGSREQLLYILQRSRNQLTFEHFLVPQDMRVNCCFGDCKNHRISAFEKCLRSDARLPLTRLLVEQMHVTRAVLEECVLRITKKGCADAPKKISNLLATAGRALAIDTVEYLDGKLHLSAREKGDTAPEFSKKCRSPRAGIDKLCDALVRLWPGVLVTLRSKPAYTARCLLQLARKHERADGPAAATALCAVIGQPVYNRFVAAEYNPGMKYIVLDGDVDAAAWLYETFRWHWLGAADPEEMHPDVPPLCALGEQLRDLCVPSEPKIDGNCAAAWLLRVLQRDRENDARILYNELMARHALGITQVVRLALRLSVLPQEPRPSVMVLEAHRIVLGEDYRISIRAERARLHRHV